MRTVVHEMRNQLAVAVANIEAFIDGKLEPTPRRLQAVLQALSELDVLLDDVPLRQTSAMPSVPHVVDICGVVGNEVLAMEASAAEKEIDFIVHQCSRTHAACRAFSGDPIRLGQAVKNLLLNAIRYTPAGGAVSVTCERDAGSFAITILDDGPGIAPEDLPRLFERGYRGAATREIPGSGMGLSVAKRIVEDHGGTITASNAPGRGASFTLRLSDSAAACASCVAQPVLAAAGARGPL